MHECSHTMYLLGKSHALLTQQMKTQNFCCYTLYISCNGMLTGYLMLTMFCRFGVCEPYNGTVEFCNGVLSTGLDYVFITKDHQSQENISRFLLENIPQDLLLAQDITDYCSNQISRVLCTSFPVAMRAWSYLPPPSVLRNVL